MKIFTHKKSFPSTNFVLFLLFCYVSPSYTHAAEIPEITQQICCIPNSQPTIHPVKSHLAILGSFLHSSWIPQSSWSNNLRKQFKPFPVRKSRKPGSSQNWMFLVKPTVLVTLRRELRSTRRNSNLHSFSLQFVAGRSWPLLKEALLMQLRCMMPSQSCSPLGL